MQKDSAIRVPDTSRTSSRASQRAQEAARKLAAQRRKFLLLAVLLALAVTGAVARVTHETMVVDVERKRTQELVTSELNIRSNSIEQYLNEQHQRVKQEAANPALAVRMLELDSEGRALLESSIGTRFYKSLRIRLIPVGTAALERDSETPIRFAELDLIRRAERRQETLPEVAVIGDNKHLQLIAPVVATDGQVVGSLMLVLSAEELLKSFAVGDSNMGEAQLLQRFPGSMPQVLEKIGQGGGGVAQEREIPGSHLVVRFTPSPYLISVARELPALWLILVCVVASVCLFAAMVAARLVVKEKSVAAAVPEKPAQQEKPTAATDAAGIDSDLVSPLYQQQDILDIAVIEEDADILGLTKATGKKAGAAQARELDPASVPAQIFRSYDIRGEVGVDLTPDLAEQIGAALGSEVLDQGENSIIVARDGRLHSEALSERLIKGIVRTGCHVIDIGVVPTPVLYFATFHLPETNSGVMVTASHNPAQYNGFKMVINGVTLADDAVQDVRSRILRQQFHKGEGSVEYRQIVGDYIDRIFSDVALAGSVKLVIDAGNAVPGAVAPQLFEELGCDVIPLHCDLDGSFPNHQPDPGDEKNLQDLIARVQETQADMGVAFDGDGDRLVVVTASGQIIWPDQLLMLFARDVLARNPGADVIFDVKCSRQLNQVISSYGGRPIMWKTGHSPMKAKMIETGALIGGEYSGHIFIKDRWYGFDDGLYAMARLLEIITLRDQSIDDIFAAFPKLPATPELKIAVADNDKFALVEKLVQQGDFPNGKPTTIDGLRVDFAKGWGLVRASNTSAALTLRFEAETEDALEKIQQLFKRELLKIDSKLAINF